MEKINYLSEMENMFLALSDKTRLRILNLMRKDEVCVYYFTEVLKESQPKISRHLAYLKNAGIVSTRREGKWIYYRITTQENVFAKNILQNTLEWLANQSSTNEEYKKLVIIKDPKIVSKNFSQNESSDESVKAYMDRSVKQHLETFLL